MDTHLYPRKVKSARQNESKRIDTSGTNKATIYINRKEGEEIIPFPLPQNTNNLRISVIILRISSVEPSFGNS
jgi:hypothetical protein